MNKYMSTSLRNPLLFKNEHHGHQLGEHFEHQLGQPLGLQREVTPRDTREPLSEEFQAPMRRSKE